MAVKVVAVSSTGSKVPSPAPEIAQNLLRAIEKFHDLDRLDDSDFCLNLDGLDHGVLGEQPVDRGLAVGELHVWAEREQQPEEPAAGRKRKRAASADAAEHQAQL